MKIYDEKVEERILKCARDFIIKRGLKGWNMDQLAIEAGIAKNTLYKIIKSKEQLVEKVIVVNIRSIQLRMNQIMNNETDYFTAINKMVSEFPLLLEVYSDSHREIFREYPSIEEKMIQRREELTKTMIDFLRMGTDKGMLRKDVRPEFIMQILQALVFYFVKAEKDKNQMKEKITAACDYLFNGIKV